MCREVEVKSCLLRLLLDWGKWLAAHPDRENSPVFIGQTAGWTQGIINTPENIGVRPSAIKIPIFKASKAKALEDLKIYPDAMVHSSSCNTGQSLNN